MSGLLTHEETLALLAKAKAGEEKAKETLVVKNIALVKSIVRGYLNRGVEFEDLMQIGSMGLLKAIERYDPSFQVRFSTYAVPMIAGEIKRFLRDDGIIKISRSLKENAVRIFGAEESLKHRLGRDPTLSELEKETGIGREDIVHAIDAAKTPVSLDEPVFQEERKTSLLDTLVAEENNEAMDQLLIQQLLSQLGERERKLIQLRFFQEKTQSEIAEMIGVSQVQVSRLLGKTLQKLKKASDAQ